MDKIIRFIRTKSGDSDNSNLNCFVIFVFVDN